MQGRGDRLPVRPSRDLRASECGALGPMGDPPAMVAAFEEALNTTSAPRSPIRLAWQFDVDGVVEAYCRLVTELDDEPSKNAFHAVNRHRARETGT